MEELFTMANRSDTATVVSLTCEVFCISLSVNNQNLDEFVAILMKQLGFSETCH